MIRLVNQFDPARARTQAASPKSSGSSCCCCCCCVVTVLGAGILTARAVPPSVHAETTLYVPPPQTMAPFDAQGLNPYAPSPHIAAQRPVGTELRNRFLWQAFGFFLLPLSLGGAVLGLAVHPAAAVFGGLLYPIGLFVLRAKTGLSLVHVLLLLFVLPLVFAAEAYAWILVVLS